MKKVKINILWFICTLTMTIEFLFSVVVSVVEAVGIKITELADAAQEIYLKAKN